MAIVFIDLRDAERHWDGENGVQVLDRDGLDGCDMALRAGDVEIVLSINQAITLYDVLDAFVNAGPIREVGAVRSRVRAAITDLLNDNAIRLTRASSDLVSSDGFARMFEEALRDKGVRWRLTGDREYEDHLSRRARRAAEHRKQIAPTTPRPALDPDASLEFEPSGTRLDAETRP